MDYYWKCLKDRNDALHNKIEQRKRILEWHNKIKEDAIAGDYPEVKKYAMKGVLETENVTTESARRQFYGLKELKKSIENIEIEKTY